jgi:hypothetical protein
VMAMPSNTLNPFEFCLSSHSSCFKSKCSLLFHIGGFPWSHDNIDPLNCTIYIYVNLVVRVHRKILKWAEEKHSSSINYLLVIRSYMQHQFRDSAWMRSIAELFLIANAKVTIVLGSIPPT